MLYALRIMARDIRESDWKVLRQLHQVALDRFCSRILAEIEGITADTSEAPYQRYLALYDTVKRKDSEIANMFDNPKRSTALHQIASFRSCGLLLDEEFMRFSEETRAIVKVFLDDSAYPSINTDAGDKAAGTGYFKP